MINTQTDSTEVARGTGWIACSAHHFSARSEYKTEQPPQSSCIQYSSELDTTGIVPETDIISGRNVARRRRAVTRYNGGVNRE